jgi:hypothetical protein
MRFAFTPQQDAFREDLRDFLRVEVPRAEALGGNSRVARGVVVVATLAAGLGIAARPDADIDRVDGRNVWRSGARDQRLKGVDIDLAVGEGRVEAAPASAMAGLQAEMDR